MKVIQVLPSLENGGVERGTLEIARALVSKGHQSWVLSAGGKLVKQLEAEGSVHIQWDLGRKSLFTLRHIPAVRRWLQQQDFDIIHVRSRMPAWIVWLAWRKMDPLTRPRLITTIHGFYSVNPYSEIMTKGERVIAVSEAIQGYILEHYPRIARSKIKLIYRGIEPEEFPQNYQASAEWLTQWYQRYPQLREQRVVTLPGRITRLKGHLVFLDAIAALRQSGINVMALVVGGEDPKRQAYAKEVYQRVAALGLQDVIIFTGARSDMKEIYSVSNLVVSLSSKPESFGRTVLEALSMGVPVVAYAHGGVEEILNYLFPEGLVHPDDFNALVTKMKTVLQHPQAVRRNDRFLLTHMQNQTLSLYQELIGQ